MQYVVLKKHISRIALLWITIAQPIAFYGFSLLKDSSGYRCFILSLLLPGKVLQSYSKGEQGVISGSCKRYFRYTVFGCGVLMSIFGQV